MIDKETLNIKNMKLFHQKTLIISVNQHQKDNILTKILKESMITNESNDFIKKGKK